MDAEYGDLSRPDWPQKADHRGADQARIKQGEDELKSQSSK